MPLATSPPTAPLFFGRVPQLLNEQQRFGALLDSLRELAAALAEGVEPLPARLEPARLVDELARVLAEHFHSAEDGLRAVASCRLDLLPAVVDTRLDHAALSRSLADLRLSIEDRARWAELPPRIVELLERLSAHREGEAALIREAARAVKVA